MGESFTERGQIGWEMEPEKREQDCKWERANGGGAKESKEEEKGARKMVRGHRLRMQRS